MYVNVPGPRQMFHTQLYRNHCMQRVVFTNNEQMMQPQPVVTTAPITTPTEAILITMPTEITPITVPTEIISITSTYSITCTCIERMGFRSGELCPSGNGSGNQ